MTHSHCSSAPLLPPMHCHVRWCKYRTRPPRPPSFTAAKRDTGGFGRGAGGPRGAQPSFTPMYNAGGASRGGPAPSYGSGPVRPGTAAPSYGSGPVRTGTAAPSYGARTVAPRPMAGVAAGTPAPAYGGGASRPAGGMGGVSRPPPGPAPVMGGGRGRGRDATVPHWAK